MTTKTNPLASTAAAVGLLLATVPCTAAEFFLKNGDRVVMMGDSITEQHMYSTYVESWSLTRFPAWDLKFFNVGIGGDGAPGGSNRFQRDVVAFGVSAMTVNFGMNDCGGPGSNFNEGQYCTPFIPTAGTRRTWTGRKSDLYLASSSFVNCRRFRKATDSYSNSSHRRLS